MLVSIFKPQDSGGGVVSILFAKLVGVLSYVVIFSSHPTTQGDQIQCLKLVYDDFEIFDEFPLFTGKL